MENLHRFCQKLFQLQIQNFLACRQTINRPRSAHVLSQYQKIQILTFPLQWCAVIVLEIKQNKKASNMFDDKQKFIYLLIAKYLKLICDDPRK
jgi:hypothetical protein